MIQEDVTLSNENDIQIDDPKNLDHFLLPDHTNAQSISKGGEESIDGGMIEKQSDSEAYQPMTLFPKRSSRSYWEILEKENNEESLLEYDSNSLEPMESRIADFLELDVPILKETTHIYFEPPEVFETLLDVFQIPEYDNLEILKSCTAHSQAFNDQSLWEMEITPPKEDSTAKFEEKGHLQTFEYEIPESYVALSQHLNADIASTCSTPMLEGLKKFDFGGLYA